MKRLFDVIVAGSALLVLAVPFAILAAAIRLADGGPAFFRQRRVGRDQVPFGMLKFRSMIVGADRIGSHMTASGDRRITPIGRLLRRTSVDELPQLWNVLVGDMSLVGPRPDVPQQEADYAPEDWALRHRVRPGLTGLAQATLRSTATAEERVRLDLDYVRRPGFFRDLSILFVTAKRLFAPTGN